MKRALVLSAVLVIALMALTLPEAAFPETAEAQTPPAQVPKPAIKIRANGKIGVNWDPVPGAIYYSSHFESDKGVRRAFSSRGPNPTTYGFIHQRYLENGSRYRVRLVAKNAAGLWSQWSEWSDWTSLYAPPAQVPKPAIKIRANGKIGVNWDPVPGAVYYSSHFESDKGVRRAFDSRGPNPITYGFVHQRYLENGSRYRARLIAKNAAGLWSEWSEWSEWSDVYGRVLSK